MFAGNEFAAVDLGNGFSCNRPMIRRSDWVGLGYSLREGLAARQIGVACGAAGAGIGDLRIGGDEFVGRDVPLLRGGFDEKIARGRRYTAELRAHCRRSAATESGRVNGRQRRVA